MVTQGQVLRMMLSVGATAVLVVIPFATASSVGRNARWRAQSEQVVFTPTSFTPAAPAADVQERDPRQPPTLTPTRTPTPINVGNFVWDDLDGDGRQDAGEPGVAGITVQLWNAAKTQLFDSATTNASGNYTVVAPLPGEYRVRVVLPSGTNFTNKDLAVGDDQLDSDINPSGLNAGFSDVYDFGSNLISITTIDAGLLVLKTPTPTRTPTPINVGNLVWEDFDGDGQQDAGEPGVAGITVQLWNAAKTQLFDSAVTNASGNYTLVAPLPGEYRVRVVLPVGASFAPKDQAEGNDQLDSDINAALFSLNRGFTDVYDFGSNLISITTIDAGLLNVPDFTPTSTPTTTPTSTPTTTPTTTPTSTNTTGEVSEQQIFLPLLQR
jgi:hypothetical protein